MYKKNCPYCKGDSYSAAPNSRWECPYCGADLTIFVPEIAGVAVPGSSAGDNDYSGSGSDKDDVNEKSQINKLIPLAGGKIKPSKTGPT